MISTSGTAFVRVPGQEKHAYRMHLGAGRSQALGGQRLAFSSSGDPEIGDYDDEPTVIFRQGELPSAFD